MPGAADRVDGLATDRTLLILLAALRVASLAQGFAQTAGTTTPGDRPTVSVVLCLLVVQSSATFVRGARRLARSQPPLDVTTSLLETAAGVAALVVLAHATVPQTRASSSFWIEPYTVVSATMIAAASANRLILATLEVVALTAAYLLGVLVVPPTAALVPGALATTWTNAMSYLGFFVVARMGFRLLWDIAARADDLRETISQLAAERARIAAASKAYRIGHDIPKALLREVSRATLPAAKLRPWAERYRDDLLAVLERDQPDRVDLRVELATVAATFAAAATLRTDLAGLAHELPPQTPALTMVEATRELLNNASFHRSGYPVALTAAASAAGVEIVVHNDGPGVDPRRLRAAWARKRNTLHQFEAAGGSYRIDSAADSPAGTTITLRYPGGDGPEGEKCPSTRRGRVATLRSTQPQVTEPGLASAPDGEGDGAPARPRANPARGSFPRGAAAIAAVAVLATLSLSLLAACWYLTGRVLAVTHVKDTYPLKVLAVDRAAGTLTVTRGPDAGEPGSFRVSWPGGQARVGPVLAVASQSVTRRLSGVAGRLVRGTRIGIRANPYVGDPRTALGIPFASVVVPTPLGGMPAWQIPGRRPTWVILIHGLGGSRADTLPPMPTLHALGYPMLAVTYRNDLGAPASPDRQTHLGASEWRDVEAAIRYALRRGAGDVVLYGYSLGAAMALVVAHDSALRRDVRQLVLDSPLLDWRATLAYAARSRPLLPQVVINIAERVLATRIGLDFAEFDQLRRESSLHVPTLLIQGTADAVLPSVLGDRFARAAPGRVSYLRVPGADHVSAIDTDPAGYARALTRFLAAR